MTIRMLYVGPVCRFLCVLLSIVMASGPSASVLAQTNAAQQAVRQRVQQFENPPAEEQSSQAPRRPASTDRAGVAAPAAGKIDTTYVSPGAVAVVVLRPAQIMASPMAQMLPTEVATAAGLKYLGFDPADVDEALAFVDMSNPVAPGYGLSIKFNKPFKGSAIPQQLRAHAQLGELNGKKYLQSQHPLMPSFYGPNNMTLVVAPDAILQQLVEGKGQNVSGPILERLRDEPAGSDLYVAVDVASLRPLIQMGLAQARAGVPPDFQSFLDAPNLVSAAELTVNISKPGTISLIVDGNDEAAATQLESLLADASRMYQERMKAQFAQQATSDDPVEQAMAKYAERVSGNWTKSFIPTREGASLVLFRTEVKEQNQQQQMVAVAVVGILVALLLPAIQAAREAARRSQSSNNLKQMMLALHNHHDMKKALPAHANYSDDGKPLLSWRVHILPFVEEQALYEQFHLDEPWDSEHNKALIARIPPVYQNPNLPLEPGKTTYLAVVGEECVFNGTKDGIGFKDVTDGTSKTVALVEADADQAVEWTKPDDWEYNAATPNAGLGNLRPGGWNAALCDGSVRFIANQIDLEMLKAMFTRAGGEVADFEAPPPRPPGAPAVLPAEPLER